MTHKKWYEGAVKEKKSTVELIAAAIVYMESYRDRLLTDIHNLEEPTKEPLEVPLGVKPGLRKE